MHIDWINFTPWRSILGGVLIGISATVFILFNGRIAGISGILGGLLSAVKNDVTWRIAFLSGLVLAPILYGLLFVIPTIHVSASFPLLVLAGLLVGFGTRLGSGCTSGHGVCGLSRYSPRSLAATFVFFSVGILTVYLVRHVLVLVAG